MNLKFWFLLLLTNFTVAQIDNSFISDFMLGNELTAENKLIDYQGLDFSPVWMNSPNNIVFGIIGQDHQRIRIKFLSIRKRDSQSSIYHVEGKSMVKGNICRFSGTIQIREIREIKDLNYGVDDEYENQGIQHQGIVIADYEFRENSKQEHSGTFSGKLYSKWYTDQNGTAIYDDIQIIADGYCNNAFIGTWTSHKTKKEKICNWGDWRVPNANSDFDIGAGEFYVSNKYWNKGWDEFAHEMQEQKDNSIESKSKTAKNKEWWK